MKNVLGLTAAAVLAAFTFSAPASADSINGAGSARFGNAPSIAGLSEGRSYYGYRRYRPYYRPYYRAYRPRYYRYGY